MYDVLFTQLYGFDQIKAIKVWRNDKTHLDRYHTFSKHFLRFQVKVSDHSIPDGQVEWVQYCIVKQAGKTGGLLTDDVEWLRGFAYAFKYSLEPITSICLAQFWPATIQAVREILIKLLEHVHHRQSHPF